MHAVTNDARATVSWEEVDALALRLADRLPEAAGISAFDRVVGVARGGLVPAALVASRLGLARVESVQIRLYDGEQRLEAPEVVGVRPSAYGPSGDPARTLIVDEIVDSGMTMRCLHGLFPQATLTALVARCETRSGEPQGGLTACSFDPEAGPSLRVLVGEERRTADWIVFPWSPPEDRRSLEDAEA